MSKHGLTEATREFRVLDLREDCVWLRLLEGSKAGLDYGVRYGGFRNAISEGETVVATVESLNDQNTEWEIKELEEGNGRN